MSPRVAALFASPELGAHVLALTALSRSDSQGRILEVTPRFCELFGYTATELVGQDYRILNSKIHPAEFFVAMWDALRQGQPWTGEICNRRKSGQLLWVEMRIDPTPTVCGPSDGFLATYVDIDEKKALKRRLRRSNEFLQMLSGHTASGVVVHKGDRLLHVNQTMVRLSGYSAAELCERPFWHIAHADFQEEITARARALLAGKKQSQKFEFRLNTRSGSETWIEGRSAVAEHQGQILQIDTYFDITEQRWADKAGRRAQLMLPQIMDSTPIPTLLINRAHMVTVWNPALERISGLAAENVTGTTEAWRGFYPEERPILANLMVDGADEQVILGQYRGQVRRSTALPQAYEAEAFFPTMGADGKGRWLFFTAALLKNEDGQVLGAIETLQDITERKLAEQALCKAHDELSILINERTAQLDDAQQQLLQSEKLASIGQLAAGVAHEINNPIGYVHSNIGSLDGYLVELFELLDAYSQAESALAADAPTTLALRSTRTRIDLAFLREDIPVLLNETKDGITRVRKIVQDLKDFSRVDSQQEWAWTDLHQNLDSTLNVANNEIKYKADVVKEYGDIPQVECLPSQLNQVFLNLMVNAAHATEDDQRGTITLRTGTQGDKVWIEVQDTGCGIAPENVKRIFDPFFTTKPIGKGTGLGLSLSYGIVQQHNGTIEVHSTVGKGTCFRVVLPIEHGVDSLAAPEVNPS